jgi:transcriptional regulator with XRE-family HTH domain
VLALRYIGISTEILCQQNIAVELLLAMEAFPKAFQRLLWERGWNQSQAASQLEISQGLVSAYLHGKREPTLTTLLNIASRLGVPLGELVGEKANQQRRRHRDNDQPLSDRVMTNLKKRWHKKPAERDAIRHLIALLFPDDLREILAWLDQAEV